MTDVGEVRQRKKEEESKNGNATVLQAERDSNSDPEFRPRESPLTVLLNSSRHIRAIYHIFIAILIILLLDTLIYDLIERGKINLGLGNIIQGFGDVRRCAKLWIFEFALSLLLYPGLLLYAAGAKFLKEQAGARALRVWSAVCVSALVALVVALLAVPVWALAKVHLAVASSVIVTLEMIRFAMKIYSITIACAPRCHQKSALPLPSFGHYVYFLFAPTFLYRDKYPRAKEIRWGVVAYHFMEVAAIIFYNSFFWERFILPYWSDYGKETTVEAGQVVRGMFACVLPGVISFLCGFYCVLHAWLNAFAEMLTFADRHFYEDWWTMSQFSHYFRAWNRVVYVWLRQYIYLPLAPRTGRSVATLAVFTVSSLFHELVLALSFGFFYPVLLIEFGVFGLLCVPLTATSGRRFPNFFNLLMWCSFLLGNGILWSLYPMEYYARKNCPPSESDSFFIPKSWSCPQVVLKPDWTFHNPIVH